MSTESVVKHHIQALADGDLEETMKDYAADCVFIGNGNVIEGVDGVRAVFEGALANGGFPVTLKDELYHGTTGFIIWEVPGIITLGTDTFVIENNLIVMQTNALVLA